MSASGPLHGFVFAVLISGAMYYKVPRRLETGFEAYYAKPKSQSLS